MKINNERVENPMHVLHSYISVVRTVHTQPITITVSLSAISPPQSSLTKGTIITLIPYLSLTRFRAVSRSPSTVLQNNYSQLINALDEGRRSDEEVWFARSLDPAGNNDITAGQYTL